MTTTTAPTTAARAAEPAPAPAPIRRTSSPAGARILGEIADRLLHGQPMPEPGRALYQRTIGQLSADLRGLPAAVRAQCLLAVRGIILGCLEAHVVLEHEDDRAVFDFFLAVVTDDAIGRGA